MILIPAVVSLSNTVTQSLAHSFSLSLAVCQSAVSHSFIHSALKLLTLSVWSSFTHSSTLNSPSLTPTCTHQSITVHTVCFMFSKTRHIFLVCFVLQDFTRAASNFLSLLKLGFSFWPTSLLLLCFTQPSAPLICMTGLHVARVQCQNPRPVQKSMCSNYPGRKFGLLTGHDMYGFQAEAEISSCANTASHLVHRMLMSSEKKGVFVSYLDVFKNLHEQCVT